MVVVVMTCYNPSPEAPRFDYASQAIMSWERYAMSPEEVNFLLSDDGSPYLGQGQDLALADRLHRTFITGPNGGIGASLNRAMDYLQGTTPWIYTTDDWVLTGPLWLNQAFQLLKYGYDMVRLGPTHPDLLCKTRFQAEMGWWLDINPAGGGFAFATRPFLAAPSLVEKVGPFREGCDAYVCERDYSDRVAALGSEVHIAQTGTVTLEGPWEHIGEYEVGRLQPV